MKIYIRSRKGAGIIGSETTISGKFDNDKDVIANFLMDAITENCMAFDRPCKEVYNEVFDIVEMSINDKDYEEFVVDDMIIGFDFDEE